MSAPLIDRRGECPGCLEWARDWDELCEGCDEHQDKHTQETLEARAAARRWKRAARRYRELMLQAVRNFERVQEFRSEAFKRGFQEAVERMGMPFESLDEFWPEEGDKDGAF